MASTFGSRRPMDNAAWLRTKNEQDRKKREADKREADERTARQTAYTADNFPTLGTNDQPIRHAMDDSRTKFAAVARTELYKNAAIPVVVEKDDTYIPFVYRGNERIVLRHDEEDEATEEVAKDEWVNVEHKHRKPKQDKTIAEMDMEAAQYADEEEADDECNTNLFDIGRKD